MAKRYPFIMLIALLALAMIPAALAQEPCSAITGCDATNGVPDSVIDAYPTPDIVPIGIDDDLLYDRTYRKVAGGLNVYDAPNGNLAATTGAGLGA